MITRRFSSACRPVGLLLLAPHAVRQAALHVVTRDLRDIHERLACIIVERLPWADLLAHYDTPETLF